MTATVLRSRRSGTGVPGYIGWLILPLGLAAFAQVAMNNGRIAVFGREADGTVIALERLGRTRVQVVPVVEFRTEMGETIVFRAFGASPRSNPYSAGDACRVRYLASDPSLAQIDSWPTLWRALLTGLAAGTLLTGGGVAIIRAAHRRRSRPSD